MAPAGEVCPLQAPAKFRWGFCVEVARAAPAASTRQRCTVTQMPFGPKLLGVRVWELAEELRVTSSVVLKLIEPYDSYVTSHFSNVPRQALDAIRASPPTPLWRPGEYSLGHPWQRTYAQTPPAGAARPSAGAAGPGVPRDAGAPVPPRPKRFRRRPGPARVTFEPPYEVDENGYSNDPTGELRYEPIWSTRDVATYFGVEPATVRKWVARGYLQPCGKQGPSHTFERHSVYAALDAIRDRTKAPGQPAPGRDAADVDARDPYTSRRPGRRVRRGGITTYEREIGPLGTLALHRLAVTSPESLLTTTETATVLGVSPATIRSWVRRGHLTPSRASTARGHRFRLTDVYTAARRG